MLEAFKKFFNPQPRVAIVFCELVISSNDQIAIVTTNKLHAVNACGDLKNVRRQKRYTYIFKCLIYARKIRLIMISDIQTSIRYLVLADTDLIAFR